MKGASKLRIYIAGQSPNSVRALANLRAICQEAGDDEIEVEVVDVLSEPGRALADGVLLTPAVVRMAPRPVRKIVGNLSDKPLAMQALGLKPGSRHAAQD